MAQLHSPSSICYILDEFRSGNEVQEVIYLDFIQSRTGDWFMGNRLGLTNIPCMFASLVDSVDSQPRDHILQRGAHHSKTNTHAFSGADPAFWPQICKIDHVILDLGANFIMFLTQGSPPFPKPWIPLDFHV